MRWLAASALGLVVGTSFGCDRIFGIHDTKLIDGSLGTDSPPTFDAQWLAMRVTGMVLVKAAPPAQDVIDFPADGITVQYGALDGDLHDAAVAADGTFLIPPTLPDAIYRLVYTAPGAIPVEVQSKLKSAHFVTDPVWGRLPRTPPPAGSGITFKPTGAGFTQPNGRVMTIGLWTQTALGKDITGIGTDFHYAYVDDMTPGATSMSGPLGSLQKAADDREILLSYATDMSTGVLAAHGYMTAQIDMLTAGMLTTAAGPWKTTTSTTYSSWGDEFSSAVRLTGPQGSLPHTPRRGDPTGGAIPSRQMPAFGTGDVTGPPAPMVLQLFDDPGSTNPHVFANPFNGTDAPALPLVETRSYYVDHQVTGGPKLTSALQSVAIVQDGNPNVTDVEFSVGAPRNVSFGGVPLKDADGLTVPRAAFIDLKFDTDKAVDYCAATFSRIDGTSLVPVKRYLVLAPSPGTPTRIDGALFDAGMTYVVRIDCYDGYDDAALANGDFTQLAYPSTGSSVATLFLPTFKVP